MPTAHNEAVRLSPESLAEIMGNVRNTKKRDRLKGEKMSKCRTPEVPRVIRETVCTTFRWKTFNKFQSVLEQKENKKKKKKKENFQ